MKAPIGSEETRLQKFITKRVEELQSHKSQRRIAFEAGYANPNIISMLKAGRTKLPLDRVSAMAKALEVDTAHLFRIAMEQFFDAETIKAMSSFHYNATDNEREILELVREASNNTDPALNTETREQLRSVFQTSAKK